MNVSTLDQVEKTDTIIDDVHVITLESNSYGDTAASAQCNNPSILLLHGWMGSGQDVFNLGISLAKSGYHVIIVDLPYHAQSSQFQPVDIVQAAQRLIDVILTVVRSKQMPDPAASPLAIIGYSLGGRVALEMHALLKRPDCKYPICLQALVLISCAPAANSSAERHKCQEASRRHADALLVLPDARAFEAWLRHTWYATPMWGDLCQSDGFNSFIASRANAFTEPQRNSWATAALRLDRSSMTSEPLFHSKTHVLYLSGADDEKYVNFEQHFHQLFKHMLRCRSIPIAGHNVLLQQGSRVTEEITSFLLQSCAPASEQKVTTLTLRHVATMDYSIALTKPMSVNGTVVSKREGFLVSIRTQDNIIGVGDVCPLPGLHSVTLETCRSEIDRFATRLKSGTCSFSANHFDLTALDNLTCGLSPVTKNAVECSVVHLISNARDERMECVLRNIIQSELGAQCESPPSGIVHVNGVLPRLQMDSRKDSLTPDEESPYLQCVTNCPFQTVKLKVGAISDVTMDARLVLEALQACKRLNKTLRLDANRAWTVSQFHQFEEKVAHHASDIQFLEEPVQTPCQLKEILLSATHLGQCSKLAIALDESVVDCDMNEIANLAQNCSAVVIKPAVIGSLRSLLHLVRIAMDTDCSAILSTVFESGVGLAWNAILASVCDNVLPRQLRCAHGLGTYSLLQGDATSLHFGSFCVQQHGTNIDLRRCETFLNKHAQAVVEHDEAYILSK